jgi:hypothetical protein
MGDNDDDDGDFKLCERSRSLMCDKTGQLWDNPDCQCVDNNTDCSPPENKCEACQQLKDEVDGLSDYTRSRFHRDNAATSTMAFDEAWGTLLANRFGPLLVVAGAAAVKVTKDATVCTVTANTGWDFYQANNKNNSNSDD